MARVVRTEGPGAARLKLLLGAATDKVGKVGWFPGAQYADGTPVAYVAAIHEYGSPAEGIPPRPFIRVTVQAREAAWRALAAQGARAILDGRATSEQVLEGIGLQAAGDIRRTITKLTTPALKPGTVAARLSRRANKKLVGNLTKPLVDTGLMLSSLTSSVEPK